MPKLRLFRGPDPLDTDTIPFPRARQAGVPFRLRLSDSTEAIRQVEEALDHAQARLDDANALMNGGWFDDDGPKAA
ncbi:MAG: hypothetical protein HND58_03345 [Planctomycetota bacterium]|nr:MAG: hypothetical protein HND58_03345 [Planctomycetota bacterium]